VTIVIIGVSIIAMCGLLGWGFSNRDEMQEAKQVADTERRRAASYQGRWAGQKEQIREMIAAKGIPVKPVLFRLERGLRLEMVRLDMGEQLHVELDARLTYEPLDHFEIEMERFGAGMMIPEEAINDERHRSVAFEAIARHLTKEIMDNAQAYY